MYLDSPFLNYNEGDSILLFEYLNDRAITHIETPYIASNKVSKGTVLRMEEHPEFRIITTRSTGPNGNNGIGFYHFKVFDGEFKANTVKENVYGDGYQGGEADAPRTSCLEAVGSHPNWAYVYIGGTKFDNNRGVLTNEIFVDHSVAKLELKKVEWTSEINQIIET